jgi:hypothetical protein
MPKRNLLTTIHLQKGSTKKQPRQKTYLIITYGLFFILTACAICYFNIQRNQFQQLPWLDFQRSFKSKEDQQLLSPVDQKPLQYNYQLMSNVYLDIYSGPVDIFYEEYADEPQETSKSRGRIVIYSKLDDKNLIITEESNGACLDGILPINKDLVLMFVTSYHCGDSKQLKITSLFYENSADNTQKLKIKSSEDYYLLDTYFQYNYSSADVKVLGWLNFDHLLVDQIYSSEGNSSREDKHQIYIFDTNNKTKELIHTFYQ